MIRQLIALTITSLLTLFYYQSNAQCSPSTAAQRLSTNNVDMLVNSSSDLWWDFNKSHYEVPKGSGRSTTFSGGIWIAGIDINGQLRMAITRYRMSGVDYWPGPINKNGKAVDCSGFDRVWKVSAKEIKDFKNNPLVVSKNIKEWPGKNNPNLAITNGLDLAPFYDANGDGNYDPSTGDYPSIKGDEALWWVFNDVGNIHTESKTDALGVEVHVMAYSFKTTNAVNNTTFYDYTILNKGSQILTDLHVGLYTDFDLGNPKDDMVGCDSSRQMAFVYNGDGMDEDGSGILGYGSNPPMACVKITDPVKKGNSTYKMSSFRAFNTQTQQINAADFYNVLQGRSQSGVLDTTPKGTPTTFMYSGKPGTTEWSECTSGNSPGDRRTLLGVGPMTFQPNEKISFSYSNIFARSVNSITACADGIQPMFDAADTVQKFVDDLKKTVSTKEYTSIGSTIKNYPNPFREKLTIDFLHQSSGSIRILDLTGKVVHTSTYEQQTLVELNLNELINGVYILENVTDQNNVLRKKIVKE